MSEEKITRNSDDCLGSKQTQMAKSIECQYCQLIICGYFISRKLEQCNIGVEVVVMVVVNQSDIAEIDSVL